ncbi:MAG: ABC transporter substrate-binding protein, partial [Methylococcales bacterium]|nr:ABC transporter substrate-binding protein [Methylococcales bacterium]
MIKKGTDNVLSVLNNSTLDPAQRRIALRKEIHLAVKTRFEFQAISKSVMSTNWKKAKGYEQDRFVDYFTQTLENTYFTAIDSYSGEEIEYLGETIKGERAVVDTAIVSETKRIPVSYRMKLTDGEWYIYDVVIENV